MTVQSKVQGCSRLIAGIAGSNPAGDMGVSVVCNDKRYKPGQSRQRNKYGRSTKREEKEFRIRLSVRMLVSCVCFVL